jgi:hypothetical protein
MIPLQKNSKFRQGIFNPKNSSKYIGREKPVYRSGWELKFFRWCDDNPNVVEWASEAVIIPYLNPTTGKVQRYYTDGVIAIRENTGLIKKYIIDNYNFKENEVVSHHTCFIDSNWQVLANPWTLTKKLPSARHARYFRWLAAF